MAGFVRQEQTFQKAMEALNPAADDFVPQVVSLILQTARSARASDIHLIPQPSVLLMQWRIDGVLQTVSAFDRELANRIVARLKVISGLLTYRTDLPQEGRVAREYSEDEVRVTTFPSMYGEKAAIRLFAASDQLQRISQLGLQNDVEDRLRRELHATAGVILLTGPSGSGKTTTAYACLRDILEASAGTRCLMTLEDPIEVAIDGVTQSQVRPTAGFDLTTGVRSLMRQDPDVILVGEIRDPATAEATFQAALTGHLVITTFHAGSAVEAVARLQEMQLEPYLIRSALKLVVCQRLLRRRCPACQSAKGASVSLSGGIEKTTNLPGKNGPVGTPSAPCSTCGSSGYFGRLVLAELLDPDVPEIARALLKQTDSRDLATLAESTGMKTLRHVAAEAVAGGLTTPEEVLRVLGSGISLQSL